MSFACRAPSRRRKPAEAGSRQSAIAPFSEGVRTSPPPRAPYSTCVTRRGEPMRPSTNGDLHTGVQARRGAFQGAPASRCPLPRRGWRLVTREQLFGLDGPASRLAFWNAATTLARLREMFRIVVSLGFKVSSLSHFPLIKSSRRCKRLGSYPVSSVFLGLAVLVAFCFSSSSSLFSMTFTHSVVVALPSRACSARRFYCCSHAPLFSTPIDQVPDAGCSLFF